MRRETALSPESAAGSSEAGSYGSPFCTSLRRGADRTVGEDLELAHCRAAGGHTLPHRALPGFRLSSEVQ